MHNKRIGPCVSNRAVDRKMFGSFGFWGGVFHWSWAFLGFCNINGFIGGLTRKTTPKCAPVWITNYNHNAVLCDVYISVGGSQYCQKVKSWCVIESGWTASAATPSDSRFSPFLFGSQTIQFVLLILVQTKGRTRDFLRFENLSCGCVVSWGLPQYSSFY